MLERYVEQYKGLAMLTPILCGRLNEEGSKYRQYWLKLIWYLKGLAGNLGSIYASRISTGLHAGAEEQYELVEWTLLLMNVPVQIVFLFLIWILNIGHLDFTFAFAFTYFSVSMISVSQTDDACIEGLC